MRAQRHAHTLFEVILVLAVLVIVGFVSLPLITPMFANNRVRMAQDMVKARWSEMRLRAINEGRPYRFAFKENTSNFRIAPDSPDQWQEDGPASSNKEQAWVFEGDLPTDILFAQPNGQVSSQGSSSQGWTRALTFLPDGTAREDVQIAFGKAGSRALTLKVQGVIGAVTSGEAPSEGNRP